MRTITTTLRLLVILTITTLIGCNTGSVQSTLEKIEQLNLNTLDGSITTYYPDGYRDRAISVATLLSASTDFFEQEFGVRENFTIALLDSSTWVKVTEIPYGLPFVSGPPNVVCLPATSNHELAETIAASIAGYDLDSKHGISNREIVTLFTDLIGFHELGHVYTWASGIPTPNKWIDEFAATYMAWAYLEKTFPKAAAIWVDAAHALANGIEPKHTSLSEFEARYVRVGIRNYAWYQSVFLLRVREVYELEGIDFLGRMKNRNWESTSGIHHLDEMQEMVPGFTNWAKSYRLLE